MMPNWDTKLCELMCSRLEIWLRLKRPLCSGVKIRRCMQLQHACLFWYKLDHTYAVVVRQPDPSYLAVFPFKTANKARLPKMRFEISCIVTYSSSISSYSSINLVVTARQYIVELHLSQYYRSKTTFD